MNIARLLSFGERRGSIARATMRWVCILLCMCAATAELPAAEPSFSPEQIEYFEKHVRPVLIARCFECHSSDAKKVEASLLVESRHGILTGGESGPAIVPGDPDKSLLIESIRYESLEMPPKAKLRDVEIAALVKWVEMGAPWPNDTVPAVDVAVDAEQPQDWNALRASHWAFRPVHRSTPPAVNNTKWPRGDIDRFILAKLEQAGMQPAPAATRRALVRRAYFDLIGLPPTPEEVDAFVNDARDDAFAHLVDRLLESPHYGERWGRHWLDVARYSDVDGGDLPHAWRYRDWVVDALNRDLPYDQFVRLQIAGDIIDPQNSAAATGFFTLGPTYNSDGGDPESIAQAMSETLDDRVDTLSRGLLGLTVSCARCHDHKFDPIPQLDYYSLAGVFNNSPSAVRPVGPQDVVDRFNAAQNQINERGAKLQQREMELKGNGRQPTPDEEQELARLRAELEQFTRDAAPLAPPMINALVEAGSSDMKLAIRGNLLRQGPIAPRRFLRILAGAEPAPFTQGSGRRELADAIADPQNPLTARVFVNRVWAHHFGEGLVRTPSNFGTLGEEPTHPELLDWLTAQFVEHGWSTKWLHREIMRSAAYQMSSRYDARNFKADGDNRLLWRMNLRRLDAEAWRDALLVVGGDLDRAHAGPPIDDVNTPRRTIYLKVSRNGDLLQPDQFLRLFDYPAMRATVERRTSGVVPQQYLFMMNNQYIQRRAELLAARLLQASPANEKRIEHAYRLLFGRAPTAEEVELGVVYLTSMENAMPHDEPSRWRQYAQVLLSSNEFMHVE